MKKMVKKNYQCPDTEIIGTCVFQLLLPHSWDPDFIPDNPGPTLPIIEGDPESDGHGANGFGLFDFDDMSQSSGNGGYDPWNQL